MHTVVYACMRVYLHVYVYVWSELSGLNWVVCAQMCLCGLRGARVCVGVVVICPAYACVVYKAWCMCCGLCGACARVVCVPCIHVWSMWYACNWKTKCVWVVCCVQAVFCVMRVYVVRVVQVYARFVWYACMWYV